MDRPRKAAATSGQPPKWILEAAESLADKFTVWRAGGLQ